MIGDHAYDMASYLIETQNMANWHDIMSFA
jgi:hypothetical protein